MYNPLNDYPEVRRWLLLVQWLTTGATTVGGVALTGIYGLDDIPGWYNVTVMTLAALWTYTGFTAQNNVTGNDETGRPINYTGEHTA